MTIKQVPIIKNYLLNMAAVASVIAMLTVTLDPIKTGITFV